MDLTNIPIRMDSTTTEESQSTSVSCLNQSGLEQDIIKIPVLTMNMSISPVDVTVPTGVDEERGVINDFNICFNIGAVTYFIPEAECLLVLKNKGH